MKRSFTKLFYRRLFALISLSFFLLSPTTSWACTSVIVGKDASATGNVLFSRNEDISSSYAKRFLVYPRGYYKAGQAISLDNYGFVFTFSHDSYKFTGTPETSSNWYSASNPNNIPDIFDESGVNEYGLAMSATNTTGFSAAASRNDPAPSRGKFREEVITSVILAECKTVEEALKLTEKLVEEVGIEGCTFMIADQSEVWIIESLSGHRWIASRVPDDSFAVIANDKVVNRADLGDFANFRGSVDYLAFAEGANNENENFAKYHADSTLDLVRTFGSSVNSLSNSSRRWRGYDMFAPSLGIERIATNNTDITYDLYVIPDKKIAPSDIMLFQRDRLNGTSMDSSESSTSPITTVAGTGTIEGHIYEMVKGFPPEIGARFWLAIGQPEHSVYLPYYGAITDTHPYYKKDFTARGYQDKSAYWVFADVATKARTNREMYGTPIREYWRAYEMKLYDEQPVIERELLRLYNEEGLDSASKFITDYTVAVADRTFAKAEKLRAALIDHIAARSGDLFVVPDDPTERANDITALTVVTTEDKTAVANLMGSDYVLVTSSDVIDGIATGFKPIEEAPSIDGYRFLSPASTIDVKLPAEHGALKTRYAIDMDAATFAAYGGTIEDVKKNLTIVKTFASAGPVKLIGPDSDALVSSARAFELGIAGIYPTADGGAHVTLDYFLIDGESEPLFAYWKLFVPDGKTDGQLIDPIWLAAPVKSEEPEKPAEEPVIPDDPGNPSDPETPKQPDSSGSGGCAAGTGAIALMIAIGTISIIRRRTR
ncbi:MAG: C69 family dipeptidase [Synergistaceae bacterium]|jgi:dipeptidase|nr:C69 family dipeptidase [Synergistaceae bacterium]